MKEVAERHIKKATPTLKAKEIKLADVHPDHSSLVLFYS